MRQAASNKAPKDAIIRLFANYECLFYAFFYALMTLRSALSSSIKKNTGLKVGEKPANVQWKTLEELQEIRRKCVSLDTE